MVLTGTHFDAQSDAVRSAAKAVAQAEAACQTCVAREEKALAKYQAVKAHAQANGGKRWSDAVLSARRLARESTALRREAAMNLREARKLLREQKQLTKEVERKNKDRERALAAFLEKWDREYELEMKRKKKNIKLRKEEIRRNDC